VRPSVLIPAPGADVGPEGIVGACRFSMLDSFLIIFFDQVVN
jgi:hypothetical protein